MPATLRTIRGEELMPSKRKAPKATHTVRDAACTATNRTRLLNHWMVIHSKTLLTTKVGTMEMMKSLTKACMGHHLYRHCRLRFLSPAPNFCALTTAYSHSMPSGLPARACDIKEFDTYSASISTSGTFYNTSVSARGLMAKLSADGLNLVEFATIGEIAFLSFGYCQRR